MASLETILIEHDPISGLYRRDIVFRKLDEMIKSGVEKGPVVLLLEMHRFKRINDGVGPSIGDRLIFSFSRRLQKASPKVALVGRMGGDGFAIILPTNENVLQTVEHILDITHRPFSIGGNVIVVDVSIGIALGPIHGKTAVQLIHAADIALHTILDDTSKDYVFFSEEMSINAHSAHLLENDLRCSIVMEQPALVNATLSSQFEIHYQPQFSTKTGMPSAVEALLRWNHPERGNVNPEVFIPIAEEIGVIHLLGEWVLKKACKDIMAIRTNTSFHNFELSVNVSPRQLDDTSRFVEHIDTALFDSGLPSEALLLEITENTILQSRKVEIEAIYSRNCSIALDDYGTGYSSMSVLRNLPIKVAKLDKMFVSQLFRTEYDSNDKGEQMIRAFQRTCEALNVVSIIEGVETKKQSDFLADIGCDYLQGFYFSKAIPLVQLMKFLNKWSAKKMASQLYQICYFSHSNLTGSEDKIKASVDDIVKIAQSNNKKKQVSGVLLFSGGYFIQVLEGKQQSVEDIFESIQCDSRHRDITVISHEDIESRNFPDWSMALAGFSSDMIPQLEDVIVLPDAVKSNDTGAELIRTLTDLLEHYELEIL